MTQVQQKVTLDEFLAFVYRDENVSREFEFVNGEIVEKMPGRASNSQIQNNLVFFVQLVCRTNHLPFATASADGSFRVGDNIVEPDFAYRTTSFTGAYPEPEPPLWVVEVISPTDKLKDVRAKRIIYLQAKILYWEIHPEDQTVDVWDSPTSLKTYGAGDVLDVGALIPGFTLAVGDLFV